MLEGGPVGSWYIRYEDIENDNAIGALGNVIEFNFTSIPYKLFDK
jgi:hypothetical protein